MSTEVGIYNLALSNIGAKANVASLDEATVLLRQIGRPGDIAMFENDLPDHYSET